MNFLEQLAAEWFEFRGYFVRTNIHFGKRTGGGYEGEIDVLAFQATQKTLLHIETSTDANSWGERKRHFVKKFLSARRHYAEIFPQEFSSVRKLAIVGLTNPKTRPSFGHHIQVQTIIGFVNEISEYLSTIEPLKKVVPEGFPLLRAIQFSLYARKKKRV